jgi:hypothetical protein
LEGKNKLTISEVSSILENSCPYISATGKTWQTYAHNFAIWMDFTDLAIFNSKEGIYKLGVSEVRDHRSFLVGRHGVIVVPPVQFSPIKEVAVRLIIALNQKERPNLEGLKRSTIRKSLMALENLGFIRRGHNTITLQPELEEFVSNSEKTSEIFAKAALKINSFFKFILILKKHQDKKLSPSELGMKLKEKLGTNWTEGTAETNAKIMLNWARNANLAPGVWSYNRNKKSIITQPTLFSDFEKE